MKLNEELFALDNENIFSKVTEKVNAYKKEHPDKDVVSLGIGDVSKPIAKPIIEAMHNAVNDLSEFKTFKGYGGYYGFDFLKQAILENEYKQYGFTTNEIYISNGTKTDTTSILELFDINSKILIGDPMYPIYQSGCLALNRKFDSIGYDDEYKMIIPKKHYDIIYLCSPSNPIGNALTVTDLKKWVKYALENKAVILFDNVYDVFVQSKDVPNSIYEIEGAKKCAIEFRSFSKRASFTSMRCSFYVIPEQISEGINKYWQRRTLNRFNGATYVAQKGALAYYLPESLKTQKENIVFYHENAQMLIYTLKKCGFEVTGGIDAPYMWVKTKNNQTGWQMFDEFLHQLQLVVIPGEIFGEKGQDHVRISALGSRESVNIAIERINKYYEKEN